MPTNRATNSDAGAPRIASGRIELGQDAACLEHGHHVTQADRLIDVVGHEQDGPRQLLLEPQQLVLEPLAHDRVDGAERLVHEHHRWVDRERPRDTHALPLAARQLARVSVAVACRIEADQGQQLVRTGPPALRVPAQEPGHDRHVVADGLVREQADLLDDVSDAPPQLDGVLGERRRGRR